MAAAFVACAGSDTQETSVVETSTRASTAAVPSALDFSAPLVDGTDFDLWAYAGEPVVFWFWAPY